MSGSNRTKVLQDDGSPVVDDSELYAGFERFKQTRAENLRRKRNGARDEAPDAKPVSEPVIPRGG